MNLGPETFPTTPLHPLPWMGLKENSREDPETCHLQIGSLAKMIWFEAVSHSRLVVSQYWYTDIYKRNLVTKNILLFWNTVTGMVIISTAKGSKWRNLRWKRELQLWNMKSYEKVLIRNLGKEKPTYWNKNLNRLNGRESTTEEKLVNWKIELRRALKWEWKKIQKKYGEMED